VTRTSYRTKLFLFVVFALAYQVFYVFPNLSPLREPVTLPLFAIDRLFPLVPWTFSIYVSDYLLAFFAIILLQEEEFFEYTRLTFASLIICGLFFHLFPTTYPRPPYPTVENPVVAFLLRAVSFADRPTNCFPSMHVAMAVTATWALRHRPRTFPVYVGWTLAICLSTLTTKQHYFLDIIGGLAVVVGVAIADRRLSAHRLLQSLLARARR
jgi:membrane-associated phospholipid phosphatase